MQGDHAMTTNDPFPPATQAADDAWLDDLLVADGVAERAGYIDDAGFTARVVEALPSAVAAPAWRRPFVAALWGGAVIAMVMAMPTFFVELVGTADALFSLQPFSLASVGVALAAVLALTWGAAAYSLREN